MKNEEYHKKIIGQKFHNKWEFRTSDNPPVWEITEIFESWSKPNRLVIRFEDSSVELKNRAPRYLPANRFFRNHIKIETQ